MFEEEVSLDDPKKVEKTFLASPPALLGIVRVPEAQRIVHGVAMFGGNARFGVDPGEVLGPLPVRVVPGTGVETDRDRDRIRFADDVEAGEMIGQTSVSVTMRQVGAEAELGIPF
ncbi:hypothetical protein [Streptomyces sp. NPDC001919]